MHWYKLNTSSIANYPLCILRIGSSPVMFLTEDYMISMSLVFVGIVYVAS